MKRTTLILTLVLVALSATAQDRLMRISAEQLTYSNDEPHLAFHAKEISRLLIPEHAEFGMIVIPSRGRENVLAYDSLDHQLILRTEVKNIWYELYKPVSDNDLSRYHAPDVKSWSVRISDIQARKLRELWRHVVSAAEDREDNMLDGVTWRFFIDGKHAKARHSYNPMVRFSQEIQEAVSQESQYRIEFLIDFALEKTIERMERLPAEQEPDLLSRCRVVDTLVIANGEILPSSLYQSFKAPNEYFYGRQQVLFSEDRYFRNPLMQRDYAENYGVIAREIICDYTTVPDTLTDAYVNAHPSMKANHRRIEGFVVDESGRPLPHAWVHITGWSGGAPSDDKGHFVFWTPHEDNILDVSCDDYSPAMKVAIGSLPVTITLKRR